MTNSRAISAGTYVLLDNHLATGTEATYTYTPSPALDLVNTYREIKIIVTGKATAALSFLMKLNANTDYDVAQIFLDTTTLSGSVTATTSTCGLLLNTILDSATPFFVHVSLLHNDAADKTYIKSEASAPHEGIELFTAGDQSNDSTITSIEFLTSTSTWIAGTEITIYGLKR